MSNSFRRLAYARIAGPAIMAAIFLFCSTFGLIVGLSANVSHPNVLALPLYPNVLSVSALTPGRVGMLSTPTMAPAIGMPTLLTNFVFDTNDSSEQVIAYYRAVMEKQYGMQVQSGEVKDRNLNNTPGIATLRYGRSALYSNWTVNDNNVIRVIPQARVVERVTITVDARTPGITRTTVYFDVLPDPGHTSPYQPR